MPEPTVHFGGPDKPPRLLRDLLQARIEAVPAGGEIIWATYYFRDRALAQALVDAHARGVRVCLHVEGKGRRSGVNAPVLDMLRAGIGPGLHVHPQKSGLLAVAHPHLHSKVYCFSHPQPTALIGSFNPSGDTPEDAAVIAEIGDQDRGHNLLVELRDPALVMGLMQHVRGLGRHALRLRPDQNAVLDEAGTRIWFYPRLRTGIVDRRVSMLPPGAAIRGAISHMKAGFLTKALADAARRGVKVRLIVHDTERRVPESIIVELAAAGVQIARYRHPEALPLHAKFLVFDAPSGRRALFGSFNYNTRSRWVNNEVLAESRAAAIVDALDARFAEIAAEGLCA